jgi:hypothetical protein
MRVKGTPSSHRMMGIEHPFVEEVKETETRGTGIFVGASCPDRADIPPGTKLECALLNL